MTARFHGRCVCRLRPNASGANLISNATKPTGQASTAIGVSGLAELRLVCPHCKGALEPISADRLSCRRDGETYARIAGIWRFLPAERQTAVAGFITEYETVRQLEGRGSNSPEYYRSLPYEDHTGRFSDNWRIRARSFDHLVRRVLPGVETAVRRPMRILDLGAGNGWLSNRLAMLGHQLVAVDLCVNDFDGLGAYIHYPTSFLPVQAEFDALPFDREQFDAAIFNASLHYSTSYEVTLGETLRTLTSAGRVIVLDSPIYRDPSSGRQMVREREQAFQERFGFPSNSLASENFLTFARLQELAGSLGIRWRRYTPFYSLGWTLKPLKARLLGRREPAKFMILVGERR